MRLSHLGTFGILLLAVSTSLAITTFTPGSEESTSTIDPSQDNESSTDKQIPIKKEKSGIADITPNQERFRQALSQEQQQNCLSQLLCGVRKAKPVSQKTNYVNDLAYVVKEFFDIIDVGGEPEDEEDDEKKTDVKTKTKVKGEAKSPYYKITNVNTKPKIVQKDDISDDEQDDDPIRNTEEALDKEVEFKYSGIKKITLEELVDDIRLRPEDIVVYKNRKGRTGRMMMTERASQDLRRKMREIKLETDDKKKMSIAADIANKLRSPRQCRQLSLVNNYATSSSACPLTMEVIKYLQTNIASGAEKHRNETALATLNYAAQQGFLLVEGDKGQAHVVDQSPLVANSFVATDLKNPTVPDRFQKVSQPPTKKPVKKEESGTEKEKDEDEDTDAEDEDDDEDADGDNEAEDDGDANDQDDEEQDEEEDSGGNEQEDEEDEEEDEEDEKRNQRLAQAAATAADLKKRAQKPQKKPSLPSGVIRVYGVPQSSFDNDFHRVAATIGNSNVQLFDQDDYDSVLMSGYPDDKLPSTNQPEKKKSMEHKMPQSHGRNSNSQRHKKRRPAPTSDSVEDEPSEDSDDDPAVEESQQIIIKSSAQKTPSFVPPFVHTYGGGGRQDYYQNQNDRPNYDPRPLPMRTHNQDFRRTDYGRPARFYPMSFPNYPRY